MAIRLADLERLMIREPGLSTADRQHWSKLFHLLGAIFHNEFLGSYHALQEAYAPVDPDSDCINIEGVSPTQDDATYTRFIDQFENLILRANYEILPQEQLEAAISAPNELGVTYVPNLSLFEHLRVYVRGKTTLKKTVRLLRKAYRKDIVVYEGYRRLVVVFKFREAVEGLDDLVRSDVLYLRMFKDVPFVDMEMHLPEQGTKVKMRLFDKAQIASPVAVGLPSLLMKLMAGSLLTMSISTLAFILAAPFTFAAKSFLGFRRARNDHMNRMIRSLYYLTKGHNTCVISRLIDSAQDEELKEAALAYFLLWRNQENGGFPWTREQVDQAVEEWLVSRTGLKVDFEIHDALQKLSRLGVLHEAHPGRFEVLPITSALVVLDQLWDDLFRYSSPD